MKTFFINLKIFFSKISIQRGVLLLSKIVIQVLGYQDSVMNFDNASSVDDRFFNIGNPNWYPKLIRYPLIVYSLLNIEGIFLKDKKY